MGKTSFNLEKELQLIHKEVLESFDNTQKRYEGLASQITKEQQARVPVDTGAIKGGLRSSVVSNRRVIEVLFASTGAPYDWFIEMGTGLKGFQNRPKTEFTPSWYYPMYRKDSWTYYNERTGRWTTTIGQPARPFFFPPIISRIYLFHYIPIEELDKACDRYILNNIKGQ